MKPGGRANEYESGKHELLIDHSFLSPFPCLMTFTQSFYPFRIHLWFLPPSVLSPHTVISALPARLLPPLPCSFSSALPHSSHAEKSIPLYKRAGGREWLLLILMLPPFPPSLPHLLFPPPSLPPIEISAASSQDLHHPSLPSPSSSSTSLSSSSIFSVTYPPSLSHKVKTPCSSLAAAAAAAAAAARQITWTEIQSQSVAAAYGGKLQSCPGSLPRPPHRWQSTGPCGRPWT